MDLEHWNVPVLLDWFSHIFVLSSLASLAKVPSGDSQLNT